MLRSESHILFKPLGELAGRKGVVKGSDNLNIWTPEYLRGLNKIWLYKVPTTMPGEYSRYSAPMINSAIPK